MLGRPPRATGDHGVAPQPQSDTPATAMAAGAGGAITPATRVGAASLPVQLWVALRALRPRQWTKNLLVFAGLIFSGRLLDPAALGHAALAFAAFCLVAGAHYIVNDVVDCEQDRHHPVKSQRPLASGRLSLPIAWVTASVAFVAGAALTGLLARLPAAAHPLTLTLTGWPPRFVLRAASAAVTSNVDLYTQFGGGGMLFALAVAAYFGLTLAYTLWLKHVVLLDVFVIATGFVLRAMAGAFAVSVRISPWFYLCTILLALFLTLGKRRQELMLLEAGAGRHRRSLDMYTPQLLDQLITIVTAATVMAYSLYTFQGETGNHLLMLTIPIVLYGIFRYLYLVYARGEGGSPEEILLRDPHVRGSVALCVLTVGIILYLPTR
jgi:4-hydroxybenzoate polyprenyltransferase